MADISLLYILELGAIVLFLYNLGLTIYRLFFHPLAKFPGPRLAAATEYYEIYFDLIKDGQFIWEMERMHNQYGTVLLNFSRRSRKL